MNEVPYLRRRLTSLRKAVWMPLDADSIYPDSSSLQMLGFSILLDF